MVRALIRAGAGCNDRSYTGETPLYTAASRGHVDAVRVLLRANANPLLTRTDPQSGDTLLPVDAAAEFGHVEVVSELVKQVGLEGCGGTSRGASALQFAAQARRVDIMVVLSGAGVVDAGGTLVVAAANGHEEAMKFLLREREKANDCAAAYVNAGDGTGRTPLLGAICFGRGSPRVVRLLINAGANTTLPFRVSNTPKGLVVSGETPLGATNRSLRAHKSGGKDAADEQLHRLEGIRRLLLRVEAVHAVSWLWPEDALIVGRPPMRSETGKSTSTPLRMMVPALRRRARRHGVLLRSLFRSVVLCSVRRTGCDKMFSVVLAGCGTHASPYAITSSTDSSRCNCCMYPHAECGLCSLPVGSSGSFFHRLFWRLFRPHIRQ